VNKTRASEKSANDFRLELAAAKNVLNTSPSPTAAIPAPRDRTLEPLFSSPGSAVVLMVRVEVTLPPLGTVGAEGSNEHCAGVDVLVQAKLTTPVKPFTEETVTVMLAALPEFTVAIAGLTEGLKSQTCSWAAVVCVRGGLTPVMVIW
jgi:hypothetical protein